MKKKLAALVLSVMMALTAAMGVSAAGSLAPGELPENCIMRTTVSLFHFYQPDDPDYYRNDFLNNEFTGDLTIYKTGAFIKFVYELNNGRTVELSGDTADFVYNQYQYWTYNDYSDGNYSGSVINNVSIYYNENTGRFYGGGGEIGTSTMNTMDVALAHVFEPLEIEEITTPPDEITETKVISSTTYSSTGEYFVTVEGTVSGTFRQGTQTVTPSAHNLTITLVNQYNGATRVMDATTINSMTVTVTGWSISEIVIKGRAQTSPGGYDTYTLVVN